MISSHLRSRTLWSAACRSALPVLGETSMTLLASPGSLSRASAISSLCPTLKIVSRGRARFERDLVPQGFQALDQLSRQPLRLQKLVETRSLADGLQANPPAE